jgi:Zn-dependent peptidase ImmA (M78 family)
VLRVSTVDVAPALLDWAVARGDTSLGVLRKKFPSYERWRRGEAHPTLRQLEEFARTTNTPVGYLFLEEPPEETVPMADFRTRHGGKVLRRSANLLDQVYLCEQRQAWYIDFARSVGGDELPFVDSMTALVEHDVAAATIRADLGIGPDFGRRQRNWESMLTALSQKIEDLGALVMISGVVGSNTHRPFDPDEFSGFSLSDPLAPVIFVNGVDTKRAQVFTLVHELAHVYLGESALSRVEPGTMDTPQHEDWCNAVAARVLVDEGEMRREVSKVGPFPEQLEDLSMAFKVSTLVILRRMLELGLITREAFFAAYADEWDRLARLPRRQRDPGGSFYNTAPVRASKRFTRAIVRSTLEGQTLYRDAFGLLGTSRSESIRRLAEQMGLR